MLFKKAERTLSKLKVGMYGREGSGKTLSLFLFAIGLHRYIKSTKPIAFFDTETGSDFMLDLAKKAGIELVVIKSRSIESLGKAFEEVADVADIFIIDSVTHPYQDLLETVRQDKLKRGRGKIIGPREWGIIKPTWNKNFSAPYVNCPVHCLWASRSKNLFEEVTENDDGQKEMKLISKGTAPRSETESAYEPSLVIEMTKEYQGEGGLYFRRALVVKDRTMLLDSQQFDYYSFDPKKITKEQLLNNPVFRDFLPHIQTLNMDATHVGFSEDSSRGVIDEGPRDVGHYRRRREIAIEEFQNTLSQIFPASTGKDRQSRFAVMSALLGTTSDTKMEGLRPEELESAIQTLKSLHNEVLHGYEPETTQILQSFVKGLRDRVPEEIVIDVDEPKPEPPSEILPELKDEPKAKPKADTKYKPGVPSPPEGFSSWIEALRSHLGLNFVGQAAQNTALVNATIADDGSFPGWDSMKAIEDSRMPELMAKMAMEKLVKP